jgi:hypothetical protein
VSTGQDWVEQARRLLETFRAGPAGEPPAAGGTASTGGPAATGADAPGSSDCRWCPLCQAAAVVRGERPEVSAALADLLASTATALRTFAGEPAPEGADPAAGAEERPAPVVQHIELS